MWAVETSANCDFPINLTRTATAVTGPRSLRLGDGSEVVLQGILPPSKLDHRSVAENWNMPEKATRALAQAAVGRSIELSGSAKTRDRYGRRVAQVHVQANTGRLWLQAYLVQTGQARVAVQEIKEACRSGALLQVEERARSSGLGLWKEAGYAIKSANKPWELMHARSTLQIIEGRVRSVARVRSRIFVNFGRQWKKDFTIGIRGRLAKKLRVGGLTLQQLRGKKIRLRGWLERRGGPFVHLHSPAQLSLAPRQKLAGETRAQEPVITVPTIERKQKRPALGKPDVLDL